MQRMQWKRAAYLRNFALYRFAVRPMPSHSLPPSRPPGKSETSSRAGREPTAQYIALMTAELAEMAETAQLEMLTYFLKMAQLEAEAFLRGEE
jgi:hypothetical protein